MSFRDLVSSMDATVLSTFGEDPAREDETHVVIHFADGTPDLTLLFVTKNPAYEEDYVPGSQAAQGQGVSVLILFVHLTPAQVSSARLPIEGDTASVGDVDYDIFRVGADREDGRTLYMRRRGQRWDQ